MNDYPLLLEVFRRNARINERLLDLLSADDLTSSDGQGGMTVGQMLSHMASSRGGWLLENGISPQHATELKDRAGGQNLWTWQTDDLTELREMFAAGDRVTVAAVEAQLHSGQPFADPCGVGAFPSSPAHFLPYLVIHDANHRGQIVALLRQNGWSRDQLDQLEEGWDILRE